MGAPEGNEFWKLRSKHGRDKIFATPELMLEAAYEYFQWCVDNPLIEVDFKGSHAMQVEIPKIRAFTLHGLCIYLDVNTVYFNQFEIGLKGKDDDEAKDFSKVITRIREIIYDQKFTGAAAGFLNPNIIARDLGLVDKSENKNKNVTLDHKITVTDSKTAKEVQDMIEKFEEE